MVTDAEQLERYKHSPQKGVQTREVLLKIKHLKTFRQLSQHQGLPSKSLLPPLPNFAQIPIPRTDRIKLLCEKMADPDIEKWTQRGSILLWHYEGFPKNYCGYHLTADQDGCVFLIGLVERFRNAQYPARKRIALDIRPRRSSLFLTALESAFPRIA
jgi:hypothetical protein